MKENNREKAMAVARDVLEWLKPTDGRKTYDVRTGMYLVGRWNRPAETDDMQQHVDALSPDCRVCALGACVLSKLRLYDALSVGEFSTKWNRRRNAVVDAGFARGEAIDAGHCFCQHQLSEIFSFIQIGMIENAFERSVIYSDFDLKEDTKEEVIEEELALLRGAAVFGFDISDVKERLAAIMENIITNGGIFIVTPQSREEFARCFRRFFTDVRARAAENRTAAETT